MSPDQFFSEVREAGSGNEKKITDRLADLEVGEPGILERWETISCSGEQSVPVTANEKIIRGLTPPHFNEVTGELAPSAFNDLWKMGLSVRRLLPGEQEADGLARAYAAEEARMAAKLAEKPNSKTAKVVGISVLSVQQVREIVVEDPPAFPRRRAMYVLNSGAHQDPSHADIVSPIRDVQISRKARKDAVSALLRCLVAGYRSKQ